MAWRPMRSLAAAPGSYTTGLRGQVNAIAPNRSTASDGLVGDVNHESTSGHYPHYVAGVGDEIVTAWDCTNDPARGCDSGLLAETLRQHRDKRIRYVISNRRIFSSYASGSRPAWTWGPYSGVDPHTNHAHIQVLDAPVSDTTTPWNLEGFATMTVAEVRQGIGEMAAEGALRSTPSGRSYANNLYRIAQMGGLTALSEQVAKIPTNPTASPEQVQALTDKVTTLSEQVAELINLVRNDTGAAGTYTATWSANTLTLAREQSPEG